MTVRVAMWSGPRNVSTALMRAFEARGDCAVVDEPLYAAYLQATGLDHPGRDAILQSQPTDPAEAVAGLQARRHGLPLQFEKHMAHHWPDDWTLQDFGDARHAFLVRHPAAMVASYARVREAPRAEDLGLPQQLELVRRCREAGLEPVVIDGDRLRAEPERWLRVLCAGLDLSFTPAMLSWAPGERSTDGVWAPYWYASVASSTRFRPPTEGSTVPEALRELVERLVPLYHRLLEPMEP